MEDFKRKQVCKQVFLNNIVKDFHPIKFGVA